MITPKNWSEFQHYKDRSPPWIKLHRGLLDNYEFHQLPDASRALAPMLWLLASEYTDGIITLTIAALAFRFRTTEKKINDALKPLIKAGFFMVDSKALAECKRDADPETEAQVKTETDSRAFERFWEVYPKREGSNRKSPALKAFTAAVRAGADPEQIISAAKKFSEREAKNIGTRFIPMAVTWLHQSGWDEFQPGPNDAAKQAAIDEQMKARGYVWLDGKWQKPGEAA